MHVNESIIRNQLQQPKEAEREVEQTIYGGRQLWQQVSVPDTGAEFREEQWSRWWRIVSCWANEITLQSRGNQCPV